MRKKIECIILFIAALLQIHVGVLLLTTPEKATATHALVVIFISLPLIYTSVKEYLQ